MPAVFKQHVCKCIPWISLPCSVSSPNLPGILRYSANTFNYSKHMAQSWELICNCAGKRDFFTPSLFRRCLRGISQSQLTLVDIRRRRKCLRRRLEVKNTSHSSSDHRRSGIMYDVKMPSLASGQKRVIFGLIRRYSDISIFSGSFNLNISRSNNGFTCKGITSI